MWLSMQALNAPNPAFLAVWTQRVEILDAMHHLRDENG
jgi:hypothetical protein